MKVGVMSPIKALFVSGSARALTTLTAVIRTKVVAVLLGPEGVGLMGLLASLQEIGAQVADGGMSHSGVRQIARSRNTPARLARIRQAMAVAICILAAIAAGLFWMLRTSLSDLVMGTSDYATSFGILGVGIAAMMIFRWRQTLQSGFQRVAAHSALTTSAAILGAVSGIAAIMHWGIDGVIWAVLLPPLAGVALAPFFSKSLGGLCLRTTRQDLRLTVAHGQALFRFGIGLMLSALAVLLTPMILRVFLSHEAGLEQVGFFQAGLVVTLHLTAVITAAVTMDYYPRLSAVAGSSKRAEALMNQQARLHLIIGGPAAALVAIAAPFLLQLLFSEQFIVATVLLQLMMLGTVLRLVAIPAEMVLMARAQAGVILRLQIAHQCFVLATALILWPIAGLEGLGGAYSLGQAVHLAMLSYWNRRTAGITWHLSRQKPMLC